MTNTYAVDLSKSDTVSRKAQRLLRMLQLEVQGHSDRAATNTALADLRRELGDPSIVVGIIAVVETRGE